MRERLTIVVALAMVAGACGDATPGDPATSTTLTSTTTTTTVDTNKTSTTTTIPSGDDPVARHPGWIRQEWPVREGLDPWAAAWGDPGMVVLAYEAAGSDDSPVANGLWFFDGSAWMGTPISDVAGTDEWGFAPEVTDLVWFGDRFLAFLMGDTTTTPGRASMLASADGINWNLEYVGAAPAAALPAGLYATPESPPYPGTSAVARVAAHRGEITAVGWTRVGIEEDSPTVPVVWRSTDGRTWSTRTLPNANFDHEWASDVAVGPLGYLVEVSGPVHQSAWLWHSPDGEEWTYVGDRFDDRWRTLIGLAVGERTMLALMMELEEEGEPLSLWRSTDGTTWEETDPPFAEVRYAEGWRLADVAGDLTGLIALAAVDGETRLSRSIDGLTWTPLPPVTMPGGDPLVRPFPLWPQPHVTHDRLELVATMPGTVIRWTESTGRAAVVLVERDDVLNVRSGPGVENEVIGTLHPGNGVLLTGRSAPVGTATWVEVGVNGLTGWVNDYYLAQPAPATNPFEDTMALDLVDDLATVFAARGDLTGLIDDRGFFVAHHERARPFGPPATLLNDPTLHAWAGTGCAPEECPDETPRRTFAEAVADSFLGAWNDEDRRVAVDEVLPGPNGLLPEAIVPAEFAGLHFVAVQDPGDNPDYGGIDWSTWYVYFAYEDDRPVVFAMSVDQWAP